jgi:hypothetical protein
MMGCYEGQGREGCLSDDITAEQRLEGGAHVDM